MWLPPADVLSDPALNRDALFVAQAWRELLDPHSPDTYRARALDPFLLLDELLKVCDLAKADQKWLSHVHLICGEIRDEEATFARLAVHPAAKHAFTTLGTFVTVKHEELQRTKDAATLAKDLSGPPITLLLDDAKSLLEDNFQRKGDFLRTLGFIATHAHRLGVSEEAISALDDCDLTASPIAVLDKIAEHLRPEEREIYCFLAISGEIASLDSLLVGTDYSRIGVARIERLQVGLDWHAAHSDKYLVQVPVRARSSRIAAENALVRLGTILNLLALYANAASHEISLLVLVEDGRNLRKVDVSPGQHYGLFPRNSHIATTRSRIEQLGERLDGRMTNVLGAHALGISAADPRAALSHFWTSLEAMVGGFGVGSIGDRVANLIAPIVTSRRIHKVVTYLALSIYETKRAMGLEVDARLMPSSTKGHVSREDVLSCLTGVGNNNGIMDLFRVCAVSPLLCFHLLNAWQDLSRPRDLAKTLKRSEQKVRWQVLRIYRARNIFVHKGGNDELVWRLLENVQSYISFVVGRIMFDLSSPNNWNLDTALEFERQHFERLCGRLEKYGEKCELMTSDFLPHLSARAHDIRLWGEGSRFEKVVAP